MLFQVRRGVLAARHASCFAWHNTSAHLCNPPAPLLSFKINIFKKTSINISVYGSYPNSPSWVRTNDPSVNSRMLYRWAIEEYLFIIALFLSFSSAFFSFLKIFIYLQNHIQSSLFHPFFLSYHSKLSLRGNHSRTSFSHCPFDTKWTRIPARAAPDACILFVSFSHAFPLSACLLRLCPRPISNSQLHALLHFHLCPIYLVVFKGSYYFRRDISS